MYQTLLNKLLNFLNIPTVWMDTEFHGFKGKVEARRLQKGEISAQQTGLRLLRTSVRKDVYVRLWKGMEAEPE